MIDPIVIDAAEDYARRGWSVVPLKEKKLPAVRWQGFQTRTTSPQDVRAWFTRIRSAVGVGIVLGPVSGHLWVRDFDDEGVYERWQAAQPDWAARLPTVRTARGYHVYGRWKDVRTRNVQGGELRAKGAYVVAPPTMHESGVQYQWVVPLPEGDVPEADPVALGMVGAEAPGCETERTDRAERTERTEAERTERAERTEGTERLRSRETDAIWGDAKKREQIENAISRTLPTQPGGRNRQVFRLARALKAIPELALIPSECVRELKPIVKAWFDRALPNMTTKDFGTTWGDFGQCWGRVRTAEGERVVEDAMTAAEASPPPPGTEDYAPQHRLLASLCRELQRRTGAGPFFLSCRTAGGCIGVEHATANRWLSALHADGILIEVKKGGAERRATRWRYVAPDLQAPDPAGETTTNGKQANGTEPTGDDPLGGGPATLGG